MQQDMESSDSNQASQPKISTENCNTKSSDSQRKLSFIKQGSKENPVIIDQKYLLLNVIYQGKSSTIFEAINIQKQQSCVVRMTLISKSDNSCKVLQYLQNMNETQLEDRFQSGKINFDSSQHIVKLLDSGVFMNQYNYQVLNKTGPSLKFWFNLYKTRFSYECIVLIVLRAIDALQFIHSGQYLHTNLNMASLLTSLENEKSLLLGNLQQSIVLKPNSKVVQKCQHLTKYSSLGQHLAIQLYPKDDLESLLYIVLQLITNGEFFYQSKSFKTRADKLQYYFQVKHSFLPEKTLRNHPSCFIEFANKIKFLSIHVTQTLDPMEIPVNYDSIRSVFKGYKKLEFDWVPVINGFKKQSTSNSLNTTQQFQESRSPQKSLDTISESSQEQIKDLNHRLVKNIKNNGDNSEIHPETQESDGEVPFEEESTDRSYVYQFK